MKMSVLILLSLFTITGSAQQPDPARINELEQKLDQAVRQLEQLNGTVLSLRAEIALIR